MKETLSRPSKIGRKQKRKDWKKKKERPNKPKDCKRKERKRKVKKYDFLFIAR